LSGARRKVKRKGNRSPIGAAPVPELLHFNMKGERACRREIRFSPAECALQMAAGWNETVSEWHFECEHGSHRPGGSPGGEPRAMMFMA